MVYPGQELTIEFEDLLELDESNIVIPLSSPIENDDNAIQKLNASSLSLSELLIEMERRGLKTRGFFADDAKVLQDELDKEHDLYLETKRQGDKEGRELEAKQALIQRRKAYVEAELKEENEYLDRDPRIVDWLRLIQCDSTPSYCRIDINDVTARSLARRLWLSSTLTCLDISCMNISDYAGAYIARALKVNTSIVKLEMNENRVGPKTCNMLAESLMVNNVLEFLALDSNPITAMNDFSGFEAITQMLTKNKKLRHLGICSCKIGSEGGRRLAHALSKNESLLCIDIGYNGFDSADKLQIKEALSRNGEIFAEQTHREIESQLAGEKEIARLEMLKAKEVDQSKKSRWIEDQKIERSEDRRRDEEQNIEQRRQHEEFMRREKERILQEEKAASKSKGKTKKKKKGKKVSSSVK